MSTLLFQEVRELVHALAIDEEAAITWPLSGRTIHSCERLPGDASDRRYYRLKGRGESYILMRMEAFGDQRENLPFLIMQKHLERAGVDVPRVLGNDPELGCVLLEDLGDVTLLRRLQEVSNSDVERHLYERVIDSLVHLQLHTSPKEGSASVPAFDLYFDFEKLMWEVQFTIEHFYQTYLKRSLRDADRKTLEQGFSEICRLLAAQPVVLCHRDFHSRNVMITPRTSLALDSHSGVGAALSERLVMIDFQDARLGPAQYDLVSLLRDSYYQLEERQVERLIDYYLIRREAISGQPLMREEFWHIFDLMTLQRNFKAIGSFASFLNRRGNAAYLKYIGNTFENIRRTLLRHPRYSALREVLFHYYYF